MSLYSFTIKVMRTESFRNKSNKRYRQPGGSSQCPVMAAFVLGGPAGKPGLLGEILRSQANRTLVFNHLQDQLIVLKAPSVDTDYLMAESPIWNTVVLSAFLFPSTHSLV
jgi:hypothetical protein